jgi:UDP-glucose 4-epimerase
MHMLSAARRVLVTGGLGFIGSHLVNSLLARGLEANILDDLSTGTLAPSLCANPRVSVHVGSVLDVSAVERAASGCDFVFHLASVVGMQRVARTPEYTYEVAVGGTRNVLQCSPDVPRVMFSSSCVYGMTCALAREDAAIAWSEALAFDGDRRGYALGKLVAEGHALASATGRGPVLIVRPFNVVGSGQTGEHGMVLPRFVARALRDEPLTIYGDGTQRRSFTDIDAFLGALMRLCDEPRAWRPPENVVNIGTQRSASVLEVANAVLRATRSRSKLTFVPYASVFPGRRDVLCRVPDLTRLDRLVGPTAFLDIDEIVERVVGHAQEETSGGALAWAP